LARAKVGASNCRPFSKGKPRLQHISGEIHKVLAFCFDCGNNSRISILFEIQDKSKGCSMSTKVRSVSSVIQTSPTVQASDLKHSIEYVPSRFTAAPTVADTSVSRQTGLAGIWTRSNDPTSQTSIPQSGMTNQMRNNTLVVRPENRSYPFRHTPKFPAVSAQPPSPCLAEVHP
jgi:hypothetical protein